MTTAPPGIRCGALSRHGSGVISADNSAVTMSIAACNSASDRSPHALNPGPASMSSVLSNSSALIHVRHSGDTLNDGDGVGDGTAAVTVTGLDGSPPDEQPASARQATANTTAIRRMVPPSGERVDAAGS